MGWVVGNNGKILRLGIIDSVDSTDTSNGTDIIYEFELYNNYPNPFNNSTTITYSLKESGNVNLELFNVMGRRVSILVNEYQDEGFYKIRFDASGLSSGVYYYRINSGNFQATQKMVYLK